MKPKTLLLISLVLTLTCLAAMNVQAADEIDGSGIVDCSLALMNDGFHFVQDIWDDNYTVSESFIVIEGFRLRVYLENYRNASTTIWLADFQNPKIARAQNITFKPYEYTEFTFTVAVIGDFILEAIGNITKPIFTISVVEYTYMHFYQQPLMLSILSFPAMAFFGVFGVLAEHFTEGKKKRKFKGKLKQMKDKKVLPIFSNPKRTYDQALIHAFNRIKRIENVPVSDKDIKETFDSTVLGFKFQVLEPELLIQTKEGFQTFTKDSVTRVLEQFPEKSRERINVSLNYNLVQIQDLPNEFQEKIDSGSKAAIDVALFIKNIVATNRNLYAMVGRQQSQLRLLKTKNANLEHERNVLDTAVAQGDSSLINSEIFNVEEKKENFFKKNKGILVMVGVIILIMAIIFGAIAIINQMPVVG